MRITEEVHLSTIMDEKSNKKDLEEDKNWKKNLKKKRVKRLTKLEIFGIILMDYVVEVL